MRVAARAGELRRRGEGDKGSIGEENLEPQALTIRTLDVGPRTVDAKP